MIDAKIFQLSRRVFGFISNNPFCFCVILGAAYFLFRLASSGFLYGADTSNKVAGIFTPLIVGGVTAYVAWNQYKLAQRQHELAREQKALTERQANIAEQQAQTAKENKDIANNKLRMDQFEKRYMVYKSILEFSLFSLDLYVFWSDYLNMFSVKVLENNRAFPYRIDPDSKGKFDEAFAFFRQKTEDLTKMKKDSYLVLSQSKFLFSEDIFSYLDSVHTMAFDLGKLKNDIVIEQYKNENVFNKPIEHMMIYGHEDRLLNEINVELHKKLKDYLDISYI